jgi:phage terminase small subunit
VDETLTKNQIEYIRHRVAGKTQRQAYLAAYPASRKWKAESVDEAACKMEHGAKVAPRLKQAMRQRLEAAIADGIVNGKDVLRELALVGFSRVTDFVRVVEDGSVRVTPTDDVPEDRLAAVASIKQTQSGIEVKLHSKVQALTKLGEALGAFGNEYGESGKDIEDMTTLAELLSDDNADTDD